MSKPVHLDLQHIAEPDFYNAKKLNSFALFRHGFRPFFLLGAFYSIIALCYFIILTAGVPVFWYSAWDAISWHRHEMLFGFAGAIIAGFLFTAVPNWTGYPTPKGRVLAAIVMMWLSGRLALFFSAFLPSILVAIIDGSFFLVCAAGIAPALIKAKNRRNFIFCILLTMMAIANFLTHCQDFEIANLGIRLALNIVILVMLLIGGRVIPFFTEKRLGISIKLNPTVERYTMIITVIALLLSVVEIQEDMLGIACMLAAIANGWRLLHWQTLKTIKVPLLWVLHMGYLWLVLGFAMKAAHLFFGEIPATVAVHAFTAGGVGVLTLGMMSRVSLGHTGRPLKISKYIIVAYVCINLAAIARVFGIWLCPEHTINILIVASIFWLLAFGIFCIIYTPVLARPRLDGLDG